MRASDLLGCEVVDRDGQPVGVVTDLRCVQDGPLRGCLAAPRVDALVVNRRHTGPLFGYGRRDQQGPWLVRTVVRRLHRHLILVPWSAVADHTGRITLRVPGSQLDQPTP
jgi:hypothetical protein